MNNIKIKKNSMTNKKNLDHDRGTVCPREQKNLKKGEIKPISDTSGFAGGLLCGSLLDSPARTFKFSDFPRSQGAPLDPLLSVTNR